MKKESEFRKYKFDKDGVSTNPDIEFQFAGKLVDVRILLAQHQLGFSVGYSFITGEGWKGETVSGGSLVNKGESWPLMHPGLYDAATRCFTQLKALFDKEKLPMDELMGLHQYIIDLNAGEAPDFLIEKCNTSTNQQPVKEIKSPAVGVRYSEEKLDYFKAIVTKKLEAAEKEEEYLQELIDKGGSESMPLDELKGLMERQKNYVHQLYAALERIANASYGICSIYPGELIEEERLRAVPHTTVSSKAKKEQMLQDLESVNVEELKSKKPRTKPTIGKKQIAEPTLIEKGENTKDYKCRVCGCTDDNCAICIRQTGEPCLWVEKDLCSACVEAKEEQNISLPNLNNTGMNFFQQLAAAGHVDFTFRILQKNNNLTININPGGTPRTLMPMNWTGTPAQLDEVFFENIIPAVKEVTGLVSNIDAVKEQAAELPADETEEEKSAPKPKKPVKKAAPKKVAKAEKKIVKPVPLDMFPE